MSDVSTSAATPPTGLTKTQLIALCAASAIPAVGMASFPVLLVGPAGYGSWLAALLTAVIGFALGRTVIVFARRYVVAGSLASYVAEVFGPWARAAVGGSLLLGYLGQLMSVQVLAAMYASSFLVSVGVDSAATPQAMIIMFLVAGIVPAVIAWRGLDASARVAVIFAAISVPLLLLISGASAWHTGLELGRQLSLEGTSLSGIIIGLGAAAAWLVSFESGATLAEETAEPTKAVPVAVMVVPVLVVGYFIVTVLQIPGLMQVNDQLAAGMSAPAALAVNAGLGETVGQVCDLLLAVGVFAALIGFTNYMSRIITAYAEDGMLPKILTRRSPKYRTPGLAILLSIGTATVALVVIAAVSAESLLTVYSAVATVIVYFWVLPYVLICVAAVVLLVREKMLTLGIVASAVIGIIGMLWPWINSLINPPPPPIDLMSYVGVVAVAVVGLAFYTGHRRNARKSYEASDHTGETVAGRFNE
ncbi:APC family permease [Rhodococcus koreensis]